MAKDLEDHFEVTFETLVYGGEALGRLPDGRAVFVPFVLPGEKARLRVTESKKRFARGELVELLQGSPQRISPRCKHFAHCGGCHYQHMPYEDQLAAKSGILSDQLTRIGHLNNPVVRKTVPSPHPWYYRNNVQFHQDTEGRLGFVNARSSGILAIEECHLPEPALNALWPQFDLDPIPELLRLGMRQGLDEEILITFESLDPGAPDFSVDFDLSAVHLGPEGSILLSGSDHVLYEVLGRQFHVSAGSFFQVNTLMAEALVEFVLDQLPLTPTTTVLDVYCGAGLFSAFLAERVGQVLAVEASPYAVYDFEINLDEFQNVTLYEGEAGVVLPLLKEVRVDLAVLDPPRSGVEIPALDALVEMMPERIAYISCDPATLARDAQRLSNRGYQLNHVTPFDLFPQTFHLESVSLWEKA